jgi:hypothetical protein
MMDDKLQLGFPDCGFPDRMDSLPGSSKTDNATILKSAETSIEPNLRK